MNVASILSKAYRLTNTNATTFLDGNSANVLADLNVCYGNRTLDILKVRQDLNFSIEEASTDLVSTISLVSGDSGYNGEYSFPSDLLRPIRAEVSFDGTTWNTAEVYDLNDNENSEFNATQIQNTFSQNTPYIRFERDVYTVRPLKDTAGSITGGIHIWYEKRQADLVAGSPEFEANLHSILSFDIAEQELLMHPNKYTNDWRNDFRIGQSKAQARFDEFFKNQFKRNFKFGIEYGSDSLNYK